MAAWNLRKARLNRRPVRRLGAFAFTTHANEKRRRIDRTRLAQAMDNKDARMKLLRYLRVYLKV